MGWFSPDIQTVEELFLHNLQDIYYAERQIEKALPDMAAKASDAELKKDFNTHLKQTKGQIKRLDRAFKMIKSIPQGTKCPAIDGMIEEANEIAGEVADKMVLNAALIAAAQAVEHYEIANFALPGRRSRHNLKYWQDRDYLGLGMAAHGFIGGVRYANHEQPADYEKAINWGEQPRATATRLSAETRLRDALIMGLRLVEGVDPRGIGTRYRVDVSSMVRSVAGDLEDAGLIVIGNNRIEIGRASCRERV